MHGASEHERGHLVMGRMFQIFSYLCERHSVEWWAAGGLALAAVRGNQILPWSGDLDVAMSHENRQKFIRYCVPELPKSIFYQSPDTDPMLGPSSTHRLRDRYSNYSQYNQWYPVKHHNGLMIDIFVCVEGRDLGFGLGEWNKEKTHPLLTTRFLGSPCYLSKNHHNDNLTIYGEDYLTQTRQCHSGAWHSTQACDHPESLEWNDEAHQSEHANTPSSG